MSTLLGGGGLWGRRKVNETATNREFNLPQATPEQVVTAFSADSTPKNPKIQNNPEKFLSLSKYLTVLPDGTDGNEVNNLIGKVANHDLIVELRNSGLLIFDARTGTRFLMSEFAGVKIEPTLTDLIQELVQRKINEQTFVQKLRAIESSNFQRLEQAEVEGSTDASNLAESSIEVKTGLLEDPVGLFEDVNVDTKDLAQMVTSEFSSEKYRKSFYMEIIADLTPEARQRLFNVMEICGDFKWYNFSMDSEKLKVVLETLLENPTESSQVSIGNIARSYLYSPVQNLLTANGDALLPYYPEICDYVGGRLAELIDQNLYLSERTGSDAVQTERKALIETARAKFINDIENSILGNVFLKEKIDALGQ